MSQPLEYGNDGQTLTDGAGLVDMSHRTRIEVLGEDRAKFLHNLSTNDVKKLQPGQGCEAFFLDARGHVVGHAFLVNRPTSIVIETVGGQQERLLNHLNRYLIREKVEFADRTETGGELFLGGNQCEEVFARLALAPLPAAPLANAEIVIENQPATLVRVEMSTSSGYLLLCDRSAQPVIAQAIVSKGAVWCEPAAFEAIRIQAGFPFYGPDITEKTLPQEVDRDETTISFKKGCYLGQETVARIDALGHVNKKLARLRFTDVRTPPAGAELKAGEQVVGHVTSAACLPGWSACLALAYLRRGSEAPGSVISSDFGQAVVIGK